MAFRLLTIACSKKRFLIFHFNQYIYMWKTEKKFSQTLFSNSFHFKNKTKINTGQDTQIDLQPITGFTVRKKQSEKY